MTDQPACTHGQSLGRRALLGGIGATAVLLGAAQGGAALHSGDTPILATPCGKLRGIRDGGVLSFKGIPYGDTTGGPRRYQPPRPAPPWAGVLDATRYGTIAPQPQGTIRADFQAILNYREAAAPGEDCLRLNVWTRTAEPGVRRPVMVWFHGGGFSSGSGGIPLYDGANLVRRGDVVVVTVNHRLASFGYLDLSWTGDERFAESGNVGNLDLIQALKWVRDTIALFGGDPDNITIFGQSGGGAKISTVMAMPAAKGLFHKAIVQSGAKLRAREPAEAEERSRRFLRALEIAPDRLGPLLDAPLAHLYAADAATGGGLIGGWGPVVNGRSLPAHPFDPEAPGLAADVPLIVGWTAEETALFDAYLIRDSAFGQLDAAALRDRTAKLWGAHREAMIAAYRRDYPGLPNWDLWLKINADAFVGRNSILMAERKARQAAPTYAYCLSWRSPVDGGRLKAFHGLDQPMVFDNLALSPGWAGTGAAAQALADRMSDAWIAFARHGSPQSPSLPNWPTYSEGNRATMFFDDHPDVRVDPASHVRRAWQNIPSTSLL